MSAAVTPLEKVNPRALPAPIVGVCALLVAVGVVAFFAGLSSDAETAWRALHVNYLYFGAIAQAGVVLASAFVIVGARWPGPVRRIAEGISAWVPFTLVFFLIGWFGGREHVYQNWLGPRIGRRQPSRKISRRLEPDKFLQRGPGLRPGCARRRDARTRRPRTARRPGTLPPRRR